MNAKSYFKVTLIIVIIQLFTSALLYSQHNHGGSVGDGTGHQNHSASATNSTPAVNKFSSFGGTVKKVGKYNIEMVFQPMMKTDPLIFFLMNKKGKPVNNQGITGKTEFTYSDNSTETAVLKPKGENGFVAQMNKKNQSFICKLTLKINDENITENFHGSSAENAISYTCSMHPEITNNKHGSCPKCGMELVKKNE
ncbi:MAG: hypothetical protein A2X08_09070 [Bacteroidetes bacterium GWA2_32_17]|nr:MAG: hypothetical protein A2X08_09070 [Bacteroidetes bacterium GWA2_32_17]